MSGEQIPAPTDDPMSWRVDQAILDADSRTAGSANRPVHLVRRVLADRAVVLRAGRAAAARGEHELAREIFERVGISYVAAHEVSS